MKSVRRKRGGSGELRAAEDRRKLVRDIDNSLRQTDQAPKSGSDPCPSCGVTGQVEVTAFWWERRAPHDIRLPRLWPDVDQSACLRGPPRETPARSYGRYHSCVGLP